MNIKFTLVTLLVFSLLYYVCVYSRLARAGDEWIASFDTSSVMKYDKTNRAAIKPKKQCNHTTSANLIFTIPLISVLLSPSMIIQNLAACCQWVH